MAFGLSSSSGITSTYVENTSADATSTGFGEDHLHIRGEYLKKKSLKFSKLGSPPHTWRILVKF